MKTIELYAGTRSFSMVAQRLGHEIFTTDYEEIDGQNLVADIHTLTTKDFPYKPDILWASPPCEGFSVASIGANWGGGFRGYMPKSINACRSMDLVNHALRMIVTLEPKWWFIENPRGVLRKLNLIPAGGGSTSHSHLLPVRRYTNEADGHMDKRSVVRTKTEMQKRGFLPCARATREQDRYSRCERIQRSLSYSFRFV